MSRSCSVLLLALLFISNSHSFQSSPHRHHPTTQRYVSLTASVTSFATASDSPPLVNWDWKKVATDVFEEDDRPIILFDGLCNLCHAGVNFAFDNDPDGESTAASPLPSLPPRHNFPTHQSLPPPLFLSQLSIRLTPIRSGPIATSSKRSQSSRH